MVGLHLSHFGVDELRVLSLATETGEGDTGVLRTALEDVVARGLGDEEAADEEDHSPENLESDGNAATTESGFRQPAEE